MTRPFGVDELLARVRAALRRCGRAGALTETGTFRIDSSTHRVVTRGAAVKLTPKEYELFAYLARHPNRVLERRRLLAAVWNEDAQERYEYLRVLMGQLRKKLEPNPKTPQFLLTEPWIGYRFNPVGSEMRREHA